MQRCSPTLAWPPGLVHAEAAGASAESLVGRPSFSAAPAHPRPPARLASRARALHPLSQRPSLPLLPQPKRSSWPGLQEPCPHRFSAPPSPCRHPQLQQQHAPCDGCRSPHRDRRARVFSDIRVRNDPAVCVDQCAELVERGEVSGAPLRGRRAERCCFARTWSRFRGRACLNVRRDARSVAEWPRDGCRGRCIAGGAGMQMPGRGRRVQRLCRHRRHLRPLLPFWEVRWRYAFTRDRKGVSRWHV